MTNETSATPEATEPPVTEQAEPSMEDILASIRKIIASDEPAAAQSADDDVLELTEIASDDAETMFTALAPEATEHAAIPDSFNASIDNESQEPAISMTEAITETVTDTLPDAPPDTTALVAADTAALSAQSFAALAAELENQRVALPPHVELGDGKQTLEQLVTHIMRPLLKEWLDTNLSTTVERLVQKEIERISKQHRD